MALPETGITISAVATEIGLASNNLGVLFCSENINDYGWNCPDAEVQASLWGGNNIIRTDFKNNLWGYVLGAFRRFDQHWKCWRFDNLTMEGTEYVEPLTFNVSMTPAGITGQYADPTDYVYHSFKMEFGRAEADFAPKTYKAAVMYSEASPLTFFDSFSFQIDASYPPDYSTRGVLTKHSTFYIKITHISSSERRYAGGLPNGGIFSFVCPDTAYTNSMELRNFTGGCALYRTYTNNSIRAGGVLYADLAIASVVNIGFQAALDVNFTQYLEDYNFNVNVPKNTIQPGTRQSVQYESWDWGRAEITKHVSIGTTIYYRYYINGEYSGYYTSAVVDGDIILPKD